MKNMAADSNYFCDVDSCQTHASFYPQITLSGKHAAFQRPANPRLFPRRRVSAIHTGLRVSRIRIYVACIVIRVGSGKRERRKRNRGMGGVLIESRRMELPWKLAFAEERRRKCTVVLKRTT